MEIPTTDQMDRTTPEERKALVGHCIPCKHWTKFIRGTDTEACEQCGGKFTNQTGLQITSQRTFNPVTAKRKGRR